MVTIVRGQVPLETASPIASTSDVIVLTFGDEKVVIHETPLGLPGGYVTHQNIPRDRLFLVRDRRAFSKRQGYDVIYSHAGFHLANVERAHELVGIKSLSLRPVTKSMVVLETAHFLKIDQDPFIEQVLDRLDPASYEGYLSTLSEDMDSRYLCSSKVRDARDIIAQHFKEQGLATYVVKFSSWCWPKHCEKPQGFNVIGIKKGRTRPQQFCLIGAHYDSVNEDVPCGKAPGANDNASGMAGVMELARVFSQLDTDISVVFVAFSGEEQDLLGSKAFVKSINQTHPFANLRAANLKSFVILDMISYYKSNYGIIVEGASGNFRQKRAASRLAALGKTYTNLEIEKTYNYGDADHEPFLDKGMPGALLIEADWDNYKYIHTANDLLVFQNIPFAIQVLRLATAMLAIESVASFR
jgi:hypothetical protein